MCADRALENEGSRLINAVAVQKLFCRSTENLLLREQNILPARFELTIPCFHSWFSFYMGFFIIFTCFGQKRRQLYTHIS